MEATLDTLGHVYSGLGDHEQAASYLTRALEVSRSLGMRDRQADALIHLGDAHEAMGNEDCARAAWREALDIMAGLEHLDAAAVRERLARQNARPGT